MQKIQFSVLGTGTIASIMAEVAARLPQYELYGVASRDITKAREFAQKYGFKAAFGSYEELVQDPKVEMVYVATPHSHHAQHAALALEHGKPVLCEKSFTANAKQAKHLVELAQKSNLLLAEAIWPRYTPVAARLRELLASGIIGRPTTLTASLGAPISHVERMASPALAGGALLDLGIYPLTFACLAFGSNCAKIQSSATMFHTGVDAFNAITLTYEDGRIACLQSNMINPLDNTCTVYGEKGSIKVCSVTDYRDLTVYDTSGKVLEHFEPKATVNGYEYQLTSFANAFFNHQIECPEIPHAESVRVMEIMDALRGQWGLRFPFEG